MESHRELARANEEPVRLFPEEFHGKMHLPLFRLIPETVQHIDNKIVVRFVRIGHQSDMREQRNLHPQTVHEGHETSIVADTFGCKTELPFPNPCSTKSVVEEQFL